MQQRTALRDQKITDNPRDNVITNLCQNIRKDIEANRAIILMGDLNEGLNSREKTHQKLTDLGLLNLMHERIEPPLPKTWNRGSTSIDHIYMTVYVIKSVKKS